MTIIGTQREIDVLNHTCDGRCADGEWCVFKDNVCPIDNKGCCLVIDVSEQKHEIFTMVVKGAR